MTISRGSPMGAGGWCPAGTQLWVLSQSHVWRACMSPFRDLGFLIFHDTLEVLQTLWPQMFDSNSAIRSCPTPLFSSVLTRGFEDYGQEMYVPYRWTGNSELRHIHLKGMPDVREKIFRGLSSLSNAWLPCETDTKPGD